jgi:hypothetical protein
LLFVSNLQRLSSNIFASCWLVLAGLERRASAKHEILADRKMVKATLPLGPRALSSRTGRLCGRIPAIFLPGDRTSAPSGLARRVGGRCCALRALRALACTLASLAVAMRPPLRAGSKNTAILVQNRGFLGRFVHVRAYGAHLAASGSMVEINFDFKI